MLFDDDEKVEENTSRPIGDQQTEKIVYDVNFHEEPIMPKEEPMDFDNIAFPKFLIPQESENPRRQKVPKTVQISLVPRIVRGPRAKESMMYKFDI